MLEERAHRCAGGTRLGERGKYRPDGLLHLQMRVEDNALVVGRTQTNREGEFEYPAARLAQNPAVQTSTNHVQLGF